jgi:hypothetical protein
MMAACEDCGVDPMPRYDGVVAGFVRPTPARSNGQRQNSDEKRQLDFNQSEPGKTDVVGVEAAVCRECYLKEFARVYPGAELPRLPALVEG